MKEYTANGASPHHLASLYGRPALSQERLGAPISLAWILRGLPEDRHAANLEPILERFAAYSRTGAGISSDTSRNLDCEGDDGARIPPSILPWRTRVDLRRRIAGYVFEIRFPHRSRRDWHEQDVDRANRRTDRWSSCINDPYRFGVTYCFEKIAIPIGIVDARDQDRAIRAPIPSDHILASGCQSSSESMRKLGFRRHSRARAC